MSTVERECRFLHEAVLGGVAVVLLPRERRATARQ